MNFIPHAFQEVAISNDQISVNENAILELLGYENGTEDAFVLESIRNYIRQTKSILSPKGTLLIVPVEQLLVSEGTLTLKGITFHIGKIIAGQLKQAEFAALFIVTIGPEVEKLSHQLFHQNEMLDGYIVNLLGSEAAESATEHIHQALKTLCAENGYACTNRFSPGYCNWDVGEQFKLFGLFPPTFNHVTLTESALMHPVKSVSSIVGIGKDVKSKGYKCQFCTDEKCIYRKKSVDSR